MPRQIPAGLNWFEAPESAAVRAHNENVFATSLVRNASAGLLYRDLDLGRAELDSIRAAFEASRDAAKNATVDPLVPELASFVNRNAYYDDQAETPTTNAREGDNTEGAVLVEANHAEDEDPSAAYKNMVEGEQAESEVRLLK